MLYRAAALAFAFWSASAVDVFAQRVGSWRNEPQSGAIVYDQKGRRIYWDDNGQKVGRYNFHSNRYERIDARPTGVGTQLAHRTPDQASPTTRRPALPALVYRGGELGYGSAARSGPRVIVSGNFRRETIYRHRDAEPPLLTEAFTAR